MGGGRALGEGRKGIYAVLPAQKCSFLEGAEPAPLERNFFSFDSANAQNIMNAEHCRIFLQEKKLTGAKVRLPGHLPEIWMYKLIFCHLFLGNNSSQQREGLQGGSSY